MNGIHFHRFFFILAIISSSIFAHNTTHYQRALHHLHQRGEVYFCFYPNNSLDVITLSNVISVDKVEGDRVFAYANKAEFETFLNLGIDYEVLTPPGLSVPAPIMSDYTDSYRLDWDTYPTYSGYVAMMNKFEQDYPDLVKVYKIGESVRGRDLLIAKVSDNVNEKESEPEWLLCAGIHGDETAPIVWSLRLIDLLCKSYQSDTRTRRILDSMETWIAPMANPDGTYRSGNNSVSGARRYNANNVDLNRNYPMLPGVGNSQNPEKETRAFMDFEKKHNFVMNIDWHAGVECVIYPYNSKSTRTPDHSWWKYVCRVYADLAQENGPSGFFNDMDNGICHGYSDLGYISKGTTKDYFYYYMHTRGVALEATYTKILPANQLDRYWNYSEEALLAYLYEILNGIRGNVTDSVTGKGLKAKVFVKNHDKDSSWVYTDSAGGHGNYYRPIYAGTYDVTYSSPGCTTRTIEDIVVKNGEATIVDVKLYCGGAVGITNKQRSNESFIAINQSTNGLMINFRPFKGRANTSIYNLKGTLITTFTRDLTSGATSIIWKHLNTDGKPISSGCYIIKVEFGDLRVVKPFIVSH